MKSKILARFVKEFKDMGPTFQGWATLDKSSVHAIKRASKNWPRHSLGKQATNGLRACRKNPDGSFGPCIDADDIFFIREAILDRHYARGVYRLNPD